MGGSFTFLPPTSNTLFFAFTPAFFLFFPPTPNPLPSGKRALRFASPGFQLARRRLRHPRWKAGVHSYSSFYLPFIWVSLFEDRVVAMGNPHCNYSIWTFRFCTYRMNTTVAHASGSESSVLFPWLMLLLLSFPCHSVANAFASASAYSSFRGYASAFLQLKAKYGYFRNTITLWRWIRCNPCIC